VKVERHEWLRTGISRADGIWKVASFLARRRGCEKKMCVEQGMSNQQRRGGEEVRVLTLLRAAEIRTLPDVVLKPDSQFLLIPHSSDALRPGFLRRRVIFPIPIPSLG
jgi:hypothetical protein